jgi:hypothetical protein
MCPRASRHPGSRRTGQPGQLSPRGHSSRQKDVGIPHKQYSYRYFRLITTVLLSCILEPRQVGKGRQRMSTQSTDGRLGDGRAGTAPDRAATYQIVVEGRLDPSWSSWFGDMAIADDSGDQAAAQTRLRGEVADQAGLHGILEKIRDLGLVLVSVSRVAGEGVRRGDAS